MQSPQSIGRTRVVVADDHALLRSGFRMLLEQIEGVEVVAEAADGDELIAIAEGTEPDLAFVDLEMPNKNGIEAIRHLSASAPHVRCVVVSMHNNVETVRQASAAGAAGYIMKDASPEEFANAVANIRLRGSYFSPAVASLLLAPGDPAAADALTDRQLEIVRMVAEGQSTKEIAFELDLSSKTVDAHRARIMERLQLGDVASLTRYAIRQGLVEA